ncbi:PssE/Cps14G family polysaccharide biosynthesis glycosyltransferase [Vibrio vulnificus]|uniref:PssE/Cps14G family polysaccharide biosynthesis glycosyltransferase n=1 Tax=Vibrio vulnificus TaxID=672 RepID=UPI0032424553
MKILVTVGTGSFDSLASYIFDNDELAQHNITLQFGKGKKINNTKRNITTVRFIDDISLTYSDYDLIITHCGAGTVFPLLELGANFIALPNIDRVDKHQLELARYLSDNRFCPVCFDQSSLSDMVSSYDPSLYVEYKKEDFFISDELMFFINN